MGFNKIVMFTSNTRHCNACLNQVLKKAWMKMWNIFSIGENTRSVLQSLDFGLKGDHMWIVFAGKQEKVTLVKGKGLHYL